jgi:hypothetical protein
MMSAKTKKESKMVLPPPTSNGSGELPPFLKPKDISKKGISPLTLLGEGRKSNSKFGEGVNVSCKIGKKNYTWSIKRNSVNYRRLYERFGSDIEKWKGIVNVEGKEYMGQGFIAVVD